MSEPYSPAERLAALLHLVRDFPYQAKFERFGSRLKDQSSFSRIEYCAHALLSGALPDADTLEFIGVAFRRYVDAGGALSLDEAFRLKSKPKAGNPSRQHARRTKISGFLVLMAMSRAYRPDISLEKTAEDVQRDDESIPVETLVREYRRRRCKKWEEEWKKEFAAINRANRL